MAWCTNLIKIQFARYVQYCHVAVSLFSAEPLLAEVSDQVQGTRQAIAPQVQLGPPEFKSASRQLATNPDRCGQITCTVMADSLLQGAGTRRMNGTDGKAQLSKCRSIKPSLKQFFVNLRRVDVLKAGWQFGLVRNKSGLWSIQVPAAGKCSESEADRGFRVNKGSVTETSPILRRLGLPPFARTFPLVPQSLG
ncbi:hypothetical protein KCU93_g206, partial [Aureobasidium melanogenum]